MQAQDLSVRVSALRLSWVMMLRAVDAAREDAVHVLTEVRSEVPVQSKEEFDTFNDDDNILSDTTIGQHEDNERGAR